MIQEQKEHLKSAVQPHFDTLGSSIFGKRVMNKFLKKFSDLQRPVAPPGASASASVSQLQASRSRPPSSSTSSSPLSSLPSSSRPRGVPTEIPAQPAPSPLSSRSPVSGEGKGVGERKRAVDGEGEVNRRADGRWDVPERKAHSTVSLHGGSAPVSPTSAIGPASSPHADASAYTDRHPSVPSDRVVCDVEHCGIDGGLSSAEDTSHLHAGGSSGSKGSGPPGTR